MSRNVRINCCLLMKTKIIDRPRWLLAPIHEVSWKMYRKKVSLRSVALERVTFLFAFTLPKRFLNDRETNPIYVSPKTNVVSKADNSHTTRMQVTFGAYGEI